MIDKGLDWFVRALSQPSLSVFQGLGIFAALQVAQSGQYWLAVAVVAVGFLIGGLFEKVFV